MNQRFGSWKVGSRAFRCGGVCILNSDCDAGLKYYLLTYLSLGINLRARNRIHDAVLTASLGLNPSYDGQTG